MLCYGDRVYYMHALTSKIVLGNDSLWVNELLEVAKSQNNVDYCLNYSKLYQGSIDRSFCGEGPFCSLKQVLTNTLSDSPNVDFLWWLLKKNQICCTYLIHIQEIGWEFLMKMDLLSELDEFQWSARNFGTLSECKDIWNYVCPYSC